MAAKEPENFNEALYSCEICGEEGLCDEEMKSHMLLVHIEGAVSCPFCGLNDITADEMYVHVNKVHLDYISPLEESKVFVDGLNGGNHECIANLNAFQQRPVMSLKLNANTVPQPCHNGALSPAGALGGHDPNGSIIICPICGYCEPSPNRLQEHINRQHFDLTSPSISIYEDANGEGSKFRCPLCIRTFESTPDLELHVNMDHSDILSPSRSIDGTLVDENSNESCPVCGQSGFDNALVLAKHIDKHFHKSSPSTTSQSSITIYSPMSPGSAKEMDVGEDEASSETEKPLNVDNVKVKSVDHELELLKRQYGMDCQGNFQEQSITNMQRAVYSGELSVTDYYTRKVDLRISELNGVDDSHSCTKGLIPKIKTLCLNANAAQQVWLCTTVAHYGSTYGDKGWGCGYRNIQMLLSSVIHHTGYNHLLFNGKNVIPSISKIQDLIERAWHLGFDPQGCEQLASRLANTRKWIGATEVVTFFSSFHIRCKLVDCHKPTGPEGSHPDLFNWVFKYFEKKEDFKPPLYLQHQGHSRTIVGIEQSKEGSLRLLIFDPSHSKSQIDQFNQTSNINCIRLIRRPLSAMKAKQYQIVSIDGIMDDDNEYQSSKMLHSVRIPSIDH